MPGSLHAQGVSELNFEELRIGSDEEKSGVEEQCWAGMRQILIDESIKKKKKSFAVKAGWMWDQGRGHQLSFLYMTSGSVVMAS